MPWNNTIGWVDTTELASRYTHTAHDLPVGKCAWIDTTRQAVIFVEKEYAQELQRLLDGETIDSWDEGIIPTDTILQIFTARFDDGYEAEIIVCSGQNNYFIDAVLLDRRSCEVCTLDPAHDLLDCIISEPIKSNYGHYREEIMQISDSVMVPRTGGGFSSGKILLIKEDHALVEFVTGNTIRGQLNPTPNEVGTKIVPMNKLVLIPDSCAKITIGQYLRQGGLWEIGETRLAWHSGNQVIATRSNKRWFNLHYVRSGTLNSANIANIDWLEIAV